MNKKVYAEPALADALAHFLETEGIQLDLTTGDTPDIRILSSEPQRRCDLDTLYANGWIECGTALNLAKKLNIPALQVGRLMNHLNIKIKHCSLGCFQ